MKDGRRVIAVGTTTTRALESAAARGLEAGDWGLGGEQNAASQPLTPTPQPLTTNLFIYPGFEFKVVTGLITNFHLPKSSLLMLVSALAGLELILSAYRHAIKNEYRFYSYGDAMLIL
jgi:S-adenosylmethionine:tRNA ribosyltransferase-isomerase